MCDKLVALGNDPADVVTFRNWANPAVQPLTLPSHYREEWRIDRPHIALYSGNIAAKQGIEIIVQASRLLAARKDLLFVVCGEGSNRDALIAAAADCGNMLFHDLQPPGRLSELLGLATVHLLPQIAGAADLILPSKLPNMLASGRPVVATARADTGLAEEVAGCGIVVDPHDPWAFARAIAQLLDNSDMRNAYGKAAQARAATRWDKATILGDFETELRQLDLEARQRRLTQRWRASVANPIGRAAG